MPVQRKAKVVALPVQTSIVVARVAKDRWLVRQNGEELRSPSGTVRKFSTERRAMLAAQRAAGIVVVDERNTGADAIVRKLTSASPDTLAKVAELLG
jgi:hypothetical protein